MQDFQADKAPVEGGSEDAAQSSGVRLQLMSRVARKAQSADVRGAIQRAGGSNSDPDRAHAIAGQGVAGASDPLPHGDAIQASFGRHDVSGVQAAVGGPARAAADQLGATAYATGDKVAFGERPDLHTAAHEAAHVVQQRAGVHLAGGVGQAGDPYEKHADAVADKVVAGQSAEALLDEKAPAGSGGAAVQRKAVQFDLKSDLYDAVEGLGTDEDAIFDGLRNATPAERRSVLNDARLMAALRDDLSGSEMARVLYLLDAPLTMKLNLAMDGIGTDEDYIMRALRSASPAEIRALAHNPGMIARLKDELSGDDLRAVMAFLPLAEKLRVAVEGMGTDEDYLFGSVSSAPIAEVRSVIADTALVGIVLDDLTDEEQTRWWGLLARRLWVGGHDGPGAFDLVDDTDDGVRDARLAAVGPLALQRALLDGAISAGTDPPKVIRAFRAYWAVEIGVSDGATMSQWPLPVIKRMHEQLKALPDQDTRSGFWNRLTLSDHSLIDPTSGQDVGLRNRAAWGGGNFIVGTQAGAGDGGSTYGVSTTLTAATSTSSADIQVAEGDRIEQGATIRIGPAGGPDGGLTIDAVSGTTWTLSRAPTAVYGAGTEVAPDDGSATREVSWLDATVRHEIAHGIDENMPATVRGFTVGIGGWWTGDFDGWVSAMPDPWSTSAATPLTDEEKTQIKDAIVDAVSNQKGSLYGASMNLPATHPVMQYQANNIPVIQAAEACLSRGDGFFAASQAFYRGGGKAFTTSFWYRNFMYFNESIIGQRVADYSLYAPTEFFAEAYTVFYEEAGKSGVTDADHGRLLRNGTWRSWFRSNIHERNQAPAGTGASGSGPGASPGGSSRGKRGGDPGP